jgi:hypothetical protein
MESDRLKILETHPFQLLSLLRLLRKKKNANSLSFLKNIPFVLNSLVEFDEEYNSFHNLPNEYSYSCLMPILASVYGYLNQHYTMFKGV